MGAKIECRWLENMAFETEVDGHTLIMDAGESSGGDDLGPRPKALTLVSLAGCTGMDVISILKKMNVNPDEFHISVEGELTKEHPRYYEKIMVSYHFKGKNLPEDKLARAVELSQEKYCGVSALLRKGTEVDYEIKIEK
ncbi:MAG TPA: OsmC family protein [Bacteroidales bacterium]|nr:OsmC family protein [Bacteroidales bacterium]